MNNETIKQGLDAIALVDKDVAKALPAFGYPEPRIRATGIETFFSIVVGQQLSTHAAAAIMKRARVLLPELNAESILSKTDDELRGVGFSKQKTAYVTGMHQTNREVFPVTFTTLSVRRSRRRPTPTQSRACAQMDTNKSKHKTQALSKAHQSTQAYNLTSTQTQSSRAHKHSNKPHKHTNIKTHKHTSTKAHKHASTQAHIFRNRCRAYIRAAVEIANPRKKTMRGGAGLVKICEHMC